MPSFPEFPKGLTSHLRLSGVNGDDLNLELMQKEI